MRGRREGRESGVEWERRALLRTDVVIVSLRRGHHCVSFEAEERGAFGAGL